MITDQTRRAVLQGAALAIPGWAQMAQPAVFAYVGSFTTENRRARGDGINVYRMDPKSGTWTHVQRVGNLVNPSFLTVSPDRRFLFSSHGDEAYATSFAIDQSTGNLTRLSQAATGGGNGAHLAIDPGGRFLLVTNYAAGTLAVLPVRPDGALADHIQLVKLAGQPGPHRIEQASSHPHQVVFDPSGRFVAVPDKGLDRVFVFRFDPASGQLSPTEQGSVVARPGSAPRHIAFHPKLPVAFVINELDSTTATYRWDAARGTLKPLQILPSLPPDHTGANTGAEIVTSGRFVYCTNRGHDSIAIYAVDQRTGLLRSIGWVPTQGAGPRFIALDPSGRFLYAANEQGDTVVTFRADPSSGRLTPTGQIVRTGSPVTIAFA